ncbi:MAG TPA: hypothetical protein VG734_25880 [Lacunisphaera sp.]|nr:hypothetical protein [Lacunisphaera sp.]
MGNDLFKIKYLGLPNTQAEVERYVYSASPCDELIANGDVTVVNIAHDTTTEGALIVHVDYVNMRLDRNRVQRLTVYP